jgi:hypothetical protein
LTILQVQSAYNFYRRYILEYSRDKSKIYQQYGFSLAGSVGSKDWEVFAAILLNDKAKMGDGADLLHYEVKSAVRGNSFEYQYHRNHGIEKLNDEKNVDHIFISRSEAYQNLEVWFVERSKMLPTFEQWLPELVKNYESIARQRFRRSVTYGFVTRQGIKILEVTEGELQYFLESI